MNIVTPSGLTTGPAGGCSDSFCPNAATRVLVHRADPRRPEFKDVSMGAFCLPCMDKPVAPCAIYEAAMLRDEDSSPGLPVPDDTWAVREFTAGEAAEIDAIRRGELLYRYISPGGFEWRKPS